MIQGVFVGLRVLGWAVICSSSLSTLLAWSQHPDELELFDDLDIGTANKTELIDVRDVDLIVWVVTSMIQSIFQKIYGDENESGPGT